MKHQRRMYEILKKEVKKGSFKKEILKKEV